MLRIGGTGTVLYANEAARALDGLLTGKMRSALERALRRAVIQAFAAGAQRVAEFMSGERIYLFALSPVAGESYLNLYGRDVTEERRASAAAQSLAKFPAENPNPVLRIGGTGTVLYANEAARALDGLLTGKMRSALERALRRAVIQAFAAGAQRVAEFMSGERIYLFALSPVAGESYLNLYGRDVTEERRANQKVIEVKNFNESILQNLSNGVITLDSDQRVTKTNPAALRILGRSDDDPIGQPLSEVFAGDNAWVAENVTKAMAARTPEVWVDKEISFGAQGRASVNLTAVPLTDADRQAIGYMLILEDISREKRIKGTMVRFMSDRVVERLLDVDESLLGGTSQEVTILFSDIRKFTSLSEKLGARDMVVVLNDYFAGMVDVIFDHDGTLDKFIGDAIMAVYGAPFVSPEDADNAVNTAIQMLIRLRAFNRERAAANTPLLEIGVGIDTGLVVAGTIGSPKRMDYTVIGDHVNLAARIESANKYYGTTILISEHTLSRLRNTNRIREIDTVRVYGRDVPVTLYEILDYHNDETFSNMDAVLAAFEKGLEHYRRREWEKGARYFGEALQGNPNDRPTQIFMGRCWDYMARPPDDSWSGVTEFFAMSA